MRVMHVNLSTHSVRGCFVVKAASQCVSDCLGRSLAMRLLNLSSLPHCEHLLLSIPVFTQCVFRVRLRVFTMRMRLQVVVCHTPPGPHNASIHLFTNLSICLPVYCLSVYPSMICHNWSRLSPASRFGGLGFMQGLGAPATNDHVPLHE